MKSERFGEFYIDSKDLHQREIAKAIFDHLKLIPTKVEFDYHLDKLHCIGISEQFELVNNNETWMTYNIDFEFNEDDDCFDISVERIN